MMKMLPQTLKTYNGIFLGLVSASITTIALFKKMATLQECMLYYALSAFLFYFGDKESLVRIFTSYKTSIVGVLLLVASWYLLHSQQATILEVSPLILIGLGALGIKTSTDIFNQNNQAQ